jgi:hypothetical protein
MLSLNKLAKGSAPALLVSLSMGISLTAAADGQSQTFAQAHSSHQQTDPSEFLVRAVQEGVPDSFQDINVPLSLVDSQGQHLWVVATPCVSGQDFGAMGVHIVSPARLGDTDPKQPDKAVLNPKEPEVLIYEPLGNNRFRLVGVEFVVFKADWEVIHKNPLDVPSLQGNLLNLVTSPNRFGFPDFYELHVWAFQSNPNGSFADWNSQVSCFRANAQQIGR